MFGFRISCLLIIVSFCAFNTAVSQVFYDSVLVNLLLSDTSQYRRSHCRTPLIWDQKAKQIGTAVKQGNLLYYLPDQYGAVFTAEKIGDSISLRRIDKTIFSGYNGGHYCFISDSKIYSFGGYGVWRTNGQLRVFIPEKGEWEIIRLNQELPSFNNFTFYDTRTGLLWCGEQNHVNEVLSSENFRSDRLMYFLDPKERIWKKVGTFTSDDPLKDPTSRILCETAFGALIFTAGPSFEILDFGTNRRFRLSEISDSLKVFATPRNDDLNFFFINGKVVAYDLKSRRIIYQVVLDMSRLSLSDVPVYKTFSLYSQWLLSLLSISIGVVIGILLFRGIKKDPGRKLSLPDLVSNSTGHDGFKKNLSVIEYEVLERIKRNTLMGKSTSVHELNRILGTDKKSQETQKSQRSKVLSSINEKYKLYYKSELKLVNITRREEDRRLVEYYVDQEALASLDGVFE